MTPPEPIDFILASLKVRKPDTVSSRCERMSKKTHTELSNILA